MLEIAEVADLPLYVGDQACAENYILEEIKYFWY